MADRLDAISGIKSRDGGKTYWTKIGAAFPNRKGGGYTLFLDYLPARRDDEGKLAILLVEPKERDERPPARRREEPSNRNDDMDDDIPFAWAAFAPWVAGVLAIGSPFIA